MSDTVNDVRCALCGEPIQLADKAFFRELPGKGLVRVHIVCYAKSKTRRLQRKRDP